MEKQGRQRGEGGRGVSVCVCEVRGGEETDYQEADMETLRDFQAR